MTTTCRGEFRRLESGSWVVVDEIQRLPGLLNEVHRFIEQGGRGARRGLRPRVARAAKGAHGPVAAEESGPLLEGWVHALLCVYMAERELGDGLSYWAPSGSKQIEVDFVLSRGEELCALEVKASRRVHPGDFAGLRAIAQLPGLRRRILVHRGERPTRTEDGIDAWPVQTFLDALEGDRLWP